MSWFRGIAPAFALLLLAACGFTPMYGGIGKQSPEFSRVEIALIPDRDGQYLRNALVDRLYLQGRPDDTVPDSTQYVLKAAPVVKNVTNMGVRRDATYTRGEMVLTTTVHLVDRNTGAVLLARDLRAAGGYNLLDNQFATIVSEQDLTERLLDELADNTVTALGLYFSGRR